MTDNPEISFIATPDMLEKSFDDLKVVNGAKVDGDSLNTFMGTAELMNMGQHLVAHMRDEARWGGSNANFEPLDFVVAAYEVAHDQTAGESVATNVHVDERQPLKMTFDIFINFWLPRVAAVAYGEEYATEVQGAIDTAFPRI